MKEKYIKQASKILYDARINLKKIDLLPEICRPKNKNDAYLIQKSLIKLYLSKNNYIMGNKIGCTNRAAQKQINVNEPFYGFLLSNYSSKSNIKIDSKKFFSPFIEPEFAFKLKKNFKIKNNKITSKEVIKYIDSVLPSIEIVDSRYNDWTTVGINHLIADNAVNSYWIYGKESYDFDFEIFNNFPIKLYINKKIIIGNSNNVLRNPINSITWYLNHLISNNYKIPKGIYISTGTCTPAIQINKKDRIIANFGSLGKVVFNYI